MASLTDVQERRLRPIYDALDSYSYKQAIQLCNKGLKKQGDALILKALKAVALDRWGREDEAFELCDEVKNAKPVDEGILQAIMMVYRAHQKHSDIIAVYESAYTQAPKNEELANHWFMALTRADDRKSMQQAAMKLHKQFKDNRYLFWTIMTVWLQAKLDSTGGQSILATLAERMIVKAAQEGRLKEYEALQLYLDILVTQGKFQEALDVVKGELGGLCKVETERKRIIVDLSKAAGRWEDVLSISKELLVASPDDWLSYTNYLEAIFKVKLETQDVSSRDDLVLQSQRFIEEQQTKVLGDKHVKRGPFLAALEFGRQLNSEQGITVGYKTMAELIANYFEQFGNSISCFDDLRPYLEGLTETDATALLNRISATASPSKPSVADVRRSINVEKIRSYCMPLPSDEKMHATVTTYVKAYKDTISLGEQLDERELQPGDDYLLLAVHILVQLYSRDGDRKNYLSEAVAVLEYGLQRSKFNFQIKLLLIRLYFELGVFQRMLDLAASLDVKQIQHDTLSFLFTDDLELLGCPELALRSFIKAMTIYASNERETPEMIVQAFKYGTFSKIPEFIRFRDRVRRSLQHSISKRQLYRVEILRRFPDIENLTSYLQILDEDALQYSGLACNPPEPYADTKRVADPIFCIDEYIESLSDNRDTSLMPNWLPSTQPIGSIIRGSEFPRKRCEWLKLHAIVPLILKAICTVSTSGWELQHAALKEVVDQCRAADLDSEELAPLEVLVKLSSVALQIRAAENIAQREPPFYPYLAVNRKETVDLSPIDSVLSDLKALLSKMTDDKWQLSYEKLRRYTLLLEGCSYAGIALASFVPSLGSAGKKSKSGKPTINPKLPPFITGLKSTLSDFHKELTRCNNDISNNKPQLLATEMFGSEPAEWMNALGDEGVTIRDFIATQVLASWKASVQALMKATKSRIDN
ncbi:hypothetical protein SpCBS45565_g04984 [Spizellomyces sp. 'palustris']|nr:hypothetical protein SpCBS45565_g04984 [Spizellomyces sp. 'palustris']